MLTHQSNLAYNNLSQQITSDSSFKQTERQIEHLPEVGGPRWTN